MKQLRQSFQGFPRPDGQAGIRNYVLLLSGTLYANPTCERVAYMVRNCIPIVHPLGRCQIAPDLAQTFRTLVGHGLNPNAGAVIVVDHFKEQGCTADEIAHQIAASGKPVEVVNIRRDGGAINALAHATRTAVEFNRKITIQQRAAHTPEQADLRHQLRHQRRHQRTGAQPLRGLGRRPDRRGRRPGAGRRNHRNDGRRTVDHRQGQDAGRGREDSRLHQEHGKEHSCLWRGHARQPAHRRQHRRRTVDHRGKSPGALQKWGSKTIVGAVDYAEPIGAEPGVWVMDTPGHGGESITGICAAGSQVMSFSTGGGHTINHPLMITMRLTGNRESWEKMCDTMEVDVSDMFHGTSLDAAGERLFNEVLDLCDGKMTKAEALKELNGFAINRCGPSV